MQQRSTTIPKTTMHVAPTHCALTDGWLHRCGRRHDLRGQCTTRNALSTCCTGAALTRRSQGAVEPPSQPRSNKEV
jgi:hypothetical protein